ncbi:hypothetical protein BpHYR1_018360 [Brachionus plicatilis]|uniref:Uncharacterized protein n=1 Tax=Brachionus plicatilis TaxID=10195 RepID=A0A3M7PC80_BRAPC|nr:hypothetical protein BpHYR1_018360 [Brachionus plicatilis]
MKNHIVFFSEICWSSSVSRVTFFFCGKKKLKRWYRKIKNIEKEEREYSNAFIKGTESADYYSRRGIE